MPSEDPQWWGAQPPCVAPLYRPPPPVDCDQHGQFLDVDDDAEEEEEGGACSLQTVVAAGRPPLPRLALDSMLASPQPLACTGTLWGQEPTQGDKETWASASGGRVGHGDCPPAAVDGSEAAGWHGTAGSGCCAPVTAAASSDAAGVSSAAADLPARLSWLGLGGAGGDRQSRPSPPSLETSPQSVPDTASVSLRSYLDCADVTADVTECETLDPLPALVDTSRTGTDRDGTSTARTEAAEQPPDILPEDRALAGLMGAMAAGSAAPVSEASGQGRTESMASPLSTGRKASTVTSLVDSGRGETVTSLLDSGRGETMTSLQDSEREQSVTSLMKFDFPETMTSVTENEHWRSETAPPDGGRREGVLSNGDAERNDSVVSGVISDTRDDIADNIADIIEKIRLETGRALLDSGVDPTSLPALLTRTNGVSSAPPNTDSDEAAPASAQQKWSLDPPLSVAEDGLFADFDGISDLGEPADPRLTHRRNGSNVPTSAAGESAPSTVPEGGRRPAADTAVPKTRPRRLPARRLSFTLESPSPLLVEYYLRHPQERQQVLESAAATVTSPAPAPTPAEVPHQQAAARSSPCPDRLQLPPPPVSGGSSPSPSSWPERPRRRWRDERPSAAELRAALVRQTSDSSSATVTSPARELVPAGDDASAPPPLPPSPGAGGDVPPPPEEPESRRLTSDLPVAWQSALHHLSEGGAVLSDAPEQEPLAPAVRPSPHRRSAPAAPPPPATLEQSPATAGAGRRRKRRSGGGGGARGTPPRYRQSPRRRPTPNFDSHHIHEIVQGVRSASPGVPGPLAWTPSASPGASPQRPPVAPSQPYRNGAQQPSPGTRHQLTGEELPGLQELRDLLTLHHHQMTSLVEQQRQQRRALEASFRRLEEALLLRLRRQMAVPDALAAVLRAASPDRLSVPASPPAPLPPRPCNGAPLRGGEVRPPPDPAEPQVPLSAHQRYDARAPRPPPPQSPMVSPSGRAVVLSAGRSSVLPSAAVGDAVPTPVARRQASSPPPQQLPVVVPSEALRPEMRARYARVTAAVRGYLTRRLMRTEKVQSMVAAAKESMACALRLQREVDLTKRVTRQDVELHERLVNQVRGACYSLHQLFVAGPMWHRLAVIAADRAARLHAAERHRSGDRAHLSRATLAALERKRQREWGAPARSGTASPRGRARPAAGSPRPRSSPQGSSRPRRVVAHSPRVPGRTGPHSDRTGSSSGRNSRTSRSLLQLTNIYAPSGPVRRAKSSQSQLNSTAPPPSAVPVSQPKRRQTAALSRAWR